MSIPVQGPGPQASQGAEANKQVAKELNQVIKGAQQDAKNALNDLSEELSGKVQIKDPNKADGKDKATKKEDLQTSKVAPELSEEMAAAVQAQDELERKKKKKKFEDKLKNLSKILSQVNTAQLDDADKKELEKFQGNINKMNTLNKRLDLLDKEEEHLEKILNQHT